MAIRFSGDGYVETFAAPDFKFRQCLPKGADLSVYIQGQPDENAESLNKHPRKTYPCFDHPWRFLSKH